MPENYPGISFNNKFICNFCLNYNLRHEYLGKEKLIEILNSVKRRGKYDCVVPLSGGKDSTYMLYYAVKELKLKPIAVTYDSGFQTELAKKNVELACKILNVPLIIKKSKGDIKRKLIRESLSISEILGSFVATCGDCEVMIRTVSLNVAREYDVPFILWGSSSIESGGEKGYEKYRHSKNRFEIIKSQFTGLRLTYKKIIKLIPRLIKYFTLVIYQRILMNVPLRYALNPFATVPFTENNPKFIHFFDYINWDCIREIELLKNVLRWEHPENRESRFDCLLHSFGNHKSLQVNHISSDGVNYCNFIRENKITRQEAYFNEINIKDSVNRECEEIIKKIGLKNYKMPVISQ